MSDAFDDPISDPHSHDEGSAAADGQPPHDSGHVETAYARKVDSAADVDGTHHHAAAPGEGEGTGIGESGG